MFSTRRHPSAEMEKVYVNPDHSSQLLVQMSELWRKDKFCDAVLVLRNARFKLHKLVLMAACPGIQATHALAEEKSHFQISLPDDYDMTSVVNVLDYLYDGAVRLRCDNVHKVKKLAKYLQLHSLVNYCMDFTSIHENQDVNVNEKNALLIKRIKQEPGTDMESIGNSKEKMANEHISSSSDIMDSSEDINVSERAEASSEHADSQTSKAGPGSVDIEDEMEMHQFQTIGQETKTSLNFNDGMKMFVHVVGSPSTKHFFIIHDLKGPFPCDNCGLTFKEIEEFKTHVQDHDWSVAMLFCNFCGEGFNNRSARNKHVNIHHAVKGKTCNQCGRQFKDSYCLSRHRGSRQCKLNIVQSTCKAQNCMSSENSANNNRLRSGKSDGSAITVGSSQEEGTISSKNILKSSCVIEQSGVPSSKATRIDVNEAGEWTLRNSSGNLDCSGQTTFPCSMSSFGQVSDAESCTNFPSKGHIGMNTQFTSSIVSHSEEEPIAIGQTVFPVAVTDATNNGSTTTSQKGSSEDTERMGQYVKDAIGSGVTFIESSHPDFALVAQVNFPSSMTDQVDAECGSGLKFYSHYNFPVDNQVEPSSVSSTYNDKSISGSAEKLKGGLNVIEQVSSMVKTYDVVEGICKDRAVSKQKFSINEATNFALGSVQVESGWNFASIHLPSQTHYQKQEALRIFKEVMPKCFDPKQKRNIYTCQFCSKEFTTASCRSKHVNLHHVGKGKTCHICGHQFKDNFSLNRHTGTRRCKLNKFRGRIFKKSVNTTEDNS
ncbi:hypothetical protein CHS0354_008174 [Potamilus streckersoni]|uniref:Uncharacterized protein n=1 Tax=Potamilus streckersoni TaxID=2493646 RepID=A0AAE0VL71_9BIVA|nr:hypothetical protein CHS0354_008174 [Potamilus streckersoni]